MSLHAKDQLLSVALVGSLADLLTHLELALVHASLTPLLGPASCHRHVLITAKEKDKRASTDAYDLLRPKFSTDAPTHHPYS